MRKKIPAPPLTDRACAAGSDCPNPGEYKAPKSRLGAGYQYLCLDHIREFNRAWDYFDGWSREEIEAFMHSASHGHRPTWKLGSQPLFTSEALRDSFLRMLGEKPRLHTPPASRREREALAALDLEPGADLDRIKVQYKTLVKKYHPDVNRHSAAEEAFKRITDAYTWLRNAYGTEE